jgi:D-glycero-D-manno-heptose 1,7-bisphosphate phosphatase
VDAPQVEDEEDHVSKRRAIFMDRDGTVCEEVGYVNHLSRVRLLPRSAEAIRLANQAGFQTVLVTNQAGVARGYFDEDLVHEVHDHLRHLLAEAGARLDGIYYCPHHPEVGAPAYRRACDCRKPKPGMLRRAEEEMGIDLARSYVVGDTVKDLGVARGVGAAAVLVLTGYGRGELEHQSEGWTLKPDHVAEDLLDAVRWILEREGVAASKASGRAEGA